MDTVDRRTLTLATMERQLLARRHPMSPFDAITHLHGLQAQEPHEPYVGLWSRLAEFGPANLVTLLVERRAVRTLLMRRTLHLVTDQHCLAYRAAHQPMLVARMRGVLGRSMPGVDLDELAGLGEPLLAQEGRTAVEVARDLGGRWPDVPPRILGDALTCLVGLVQTPPRGVWGEQAPARVTTIRTWLGRDPEASADALDQLVLGYLTAYGPASSSDVRAWSGLGGLPAVITRLRPRLRFLRDDAGRRLLDLADAALPEHDRPLPPRFLPAFDNVVLGYHDRSRVIDDDHRGLSVGGARFVLVDGRVAGIWTSSRQAPGPGGTPGPVTVSVTWLRPVPTDAQDAVRAEGERLATFLGDGRPGSVAFPAA